MPVQTFNCPSCGAPLDDDGSGDKTIRCPYCDNSVVVPAELLGDTPPPVQVFVSRARAESPGRGQRPGGVGTFLAIGLISLLLLGIGLSVFVAGRSARQARAEIKNTAVPPLVTRALASPFPTATLQPSPTPGYASPVLVFGGEGIGPGLLSDARSLAVDGQGLVYVADYEGGRVQVFDAQGKYLSQWKVGGEQTHIQGLAANHQGEVFVAADGEIFRYLGATGKSQGKLAYPAGPEFGDLAVPADGGLLAVWYEGRWGLITSLEGHREALVRFDADGDPVSAALSFISDQTGGLALDVFLAVDGRGYVYALSSYDGAVFKFGPNGKFIDRFSIGGDQPGRLQSASDIAVDSQGQVYLAGGAVISVFLPEGRYLTSFDAGAYVDSLVFDEQDDLYTLARDQVTRFVLNAK